MSPGPTFDRVYVWLKEQLVGGLLLPGAALEPAHLTDTLATSITPIRDALHRLAGERLVDASWGDGFRVPAPTEADLRALYAWNLALIDLAVRGVSPARPSEPEPDPKPSIEQIALYLARRGGPEHVSAIMSLNDRLGPARSAEPEVLPDIAQEVEAICKLLGQNDDRSLRRALSAYHRRRIRAVADTVVAMRNQRSEARRQ